MLLFHAETSPMCLSVQQYTGSSLCRRVGDLLSHVLLKLLQVLVSVLPPLTFADILIKRLKVTQLYKPVLSIISPC